MRDKTPNADTTAEGSSRVLLYGGAWWARQSWGSGRYLVEIMVKRVRTGRVLLAGPPVARRHALALDTDHSAAKVADCMLEWLSRQPNHVVAATRWQDFARLIGSAWLPGAELAERSVAVRLQPVGGQRSRTPDGNKISPDRDRPRRGTAVPA